MSKGSCGLQRSGVLLETASDRTLSGPKAMRGFENGSLDGVLKIFLEVTTLMPNLNPNAY